VCAPEAAGEGNCRSEEGKRFFLKKEAKPFALVPRTGDARHAAR
jgi:hypothetical protein